MEKNSIAAPMKRSFLEKSINVKLVILLLLQTIVCIVCSIGHNKWKLDHVDDTGSWYLDDFKNDFMHLACTHSLTPFDSIRYVSYLILYNTMIPLSMYVSLEVVRVTNAVQITKGGIPGSATRTTTIMEELGQVQYIFADKTGTLTRYPLSHLEMHLLIYINRNEMAVRKLSIVGIPDPETVPMDASERDEKSKEEGDEEFGQIQNGEKEESSKREIKRTESASYILKRSYSALSIREECLLVMALCNTVQVERDDAGALKYPMARYISKT